MSILFFDIIFSFIKLKILTVKIHQLFLEVVRVLHLLHSIPNIYAIWCVYPQKSTILWNSQRRRLAEISEMTCDLLFSMIQHTNSFMEGKKEMKSRLKIDWYLFSLCSEVVPEQQLILDILSQQPLMGMKHRQLSLRFSSPYDCFCYTLDMTIIFCSISHCHENSFKQKIYY